MAAAAQPKGSVSTGSIKPVTRKAVRCQREVAWLITQAAGKLVATIDDVNAPTPSFVLAAALSHVRAQQHAAQDHGRTIDYKAVMAPDLASFCAAAGLPTARNALSDAGYMFTLSGADSSATFTPTVVTWANARVTRRRSNRATRSSSRCDCSCWMPPLPAALPPKTTPLHSKSAGPGNQSRPGDCSFYLSPSPTGEFFWLRRLLQVTLCSL